MNRDPGPRAELALAQMEGVTERREDVQCHRVQQEDGAVRIVAHDDGRGTLERDGFGLSGMRERLERGGGAMRIASEPGHGFGITAVLPLRGAA